MRLILQSAALLLVAALASTASAQAPPDNSHVPLIPFDTVAALRSCNARERGPGISVTRCRCCGNVGPPRMSRLMM